MALTVDATMVEGAENQEEAGWEEESGDAEAPVREERPAPAPAGSVVIGTFVDIDDNGRFLVNFPENPEPRPLTAQSTVSLTRDHIGRPVALLFSEGDWRQPVVMGLIHNALDALLVHPSRARNEEDSGTKPVSENTELQEVSAARVDGESVVIEGRKEVVLKCGDASITLTRAGKILIRGTYLLNRSSGVNRILGGSVQVN